MVAAAISQRLSETRDRIAALAAPLQPVVAFATNAYALVFPYLVKAFHYGFIPLVLGLGVFTANPRPKLFWDLLTPM